MRSKGFTLIELLIVVAIIAILAAIAVPNFLEAQTRAKVSRVKSDMRSVATAIESYHIDSNHYPLPWFGSSMGGSELGAFQMLTTPVAHMTSIPRDPFLPPFEPSNSSSLFSTYPPYESFKYYMNDEASYEAAGWSSPNWTDITRTDSPFYGGKYHYLMLSFGPDYAQEAELPRVPFIGQDDGVGYDPTNGTVSKGEIYRFGPGGNPAGYP